MSKTFFVFLVFTSLLCLMASFANAFDFFDQVEPGKKIQISDSKYQDKVFGGDEQQKLIIKFIPGGTDLSHNAGEADGKDGDYAIIVDTDGDNQLNDESIIASGSVKRLSGVVYQMDRTQLSQLPDGAYNVWVVIDNIADGFINWGLTDQKFDTFILDRTLKVTEVYCDPVAFSPNGDGFKDVTHIKYNLSEDLSAIYEQVIITIGEGQLGSPAKPLAGTLLGYNTVIWNGRDGFNNLAPDGTYTVKIEARDQGGNYVVTTTTVKLYTTSPDIASTEPAVNSNVNVLSQVVAYIKDNSGVGIYFGSPTIIRLNPSNATTAGSQVNDAANKKMIWKLNNPLPTNGTADGLYTIDVIVYDIAGNKKVGSFAFRYDTVLPQFTSITPADGSLLQTPPNQIVAKFADTGSGLDIAATAASMKVTGSVIPGSITHNGVDTVTFTPTFPLTPGLYTVEVTPIDKAGNKPPVPLKSTFTIAGSATGLLPEVVSAEPAAGSSVNSVSQVSVTLKDNSGKGLDLDASTIELRNPGNVLVPGSKIKDESKSKITWKLVNPLPTNGTADGLYSVVYTVADKSGGTNNGSFTFTYDTVVPQVASITPADGAVLTTPPTKVTVVISDVGSGVDLTATGATMKVYGSVLPGLVTHDGINTITYTFAEQVSVGKHDVEITPTDKAGNKPVLPLKFSFIVVEDVSDLLPSVVSTSPENGSLVSSISQVVVILKDNSGKGIDFVNSTVRLENPANVVVDGTQIVDEPTNKLTWKLTKSLAADGTADGVYKIKVRAADKNGGVKDYIFTFTLDTQASMVIAVSPANNAVVTAALTEIAIKVDDKTGTGVDFAYSKNTMKLKLGTKEITGIVRTDNGIDTMTFKFLPLEDVGTYTIEITIKDNAGNLYPFQSKFEYTKYVSRADFYEKLQVIDSKYEDRVFGGDDQPELIITFTPEVTQDSGESASHHGDWAIIVDADDDGDLINDDILASGNAVNNTPVTYRLNRSKLSGLPDGDYEVGIVIDNKANGKIDWDDYDDDTEKFTLDRKLEISEVSVSPSAFSPNGDGVNDFVYIYYTLSENLASKYSDLTITIGSGKLGSPAKPTASKLKGKNTALWDGRDGLGNYVDDGSYTIKIDAYDNGGNKASVSIQVEVNAKKPEVTNTQPALDSSVSILTEVSATLKDNSGKGIDLEKSLIRLNTPSGVEVPGEQRDNGKDTIRWRITRPLAGDGTADGRYTIVVTVVDKAGNRATYSYPFFYDTVFPQITGVYPANDSILTDPPSVIVIAMKDGTGSGPDLATSAKTFQLVKDGGNKVAGSTTHNGVDTINFTPFEKLSNGKYTMTITPTDFAGNKPSQPVEFRFTVVEKISDAYPSVVSVDPPDRAFKSFINQVKAVLAKGSTDAELDIDASTIRLENPNGVEVPGIQTNNGKDTIIWELMSPLPTDGTADGKYTIRVKSVDKSKRVTQKSYNFLYDSQVPSVTSIAPLNKSTLTVAPMEIVVKVTDGTGSGVDFASSRNSMKLKVSGKEIANILRKDNGVDTITFVLPELEDKGRYTIELTMKDNAGNAYTYQFRFDLIDEDTTFMPEVVSVDPSDRSFKNTINQVSAVLKDNSSKGLNLALSTINLLNPGGIVVPGVQLNNSKDTIIWELTSPLPSDGTADGRYTIKVKAVDKAGGIIEESFTFTYDTLVPVITSVTPADKSTLRTAPKQIVLKVNDGAGSGLDFASSRNSMKFKLDGKEIANIIRKDNGVDTITFILPDLEDKGRYTTEITMKDKAGNAYTYTFRFDLVDEETTFMPVITSVDPEDRAFRNAISQVKAVLKDNSGKGLSFELSSIFLESPRGGKVAGIQKDNDKDTIIWELTSPLPTDGTADGRYTIRVKAVDKAGGITEDNFTFLYDTVVPAVIEITPEDKSTLRAAPAEIVVKVSDGNGSGVDFTSSKASMKLKISGKEIANILRKDNGKDTITFVLPELEDKGRYTIELTMKDNAGNAYTYQFRFDLVDKETTFMPEIVSVDPADRSFRNSVTQAKAVLKDNSSKGLNLESSTIIIMDPNGVVLSGIQTNNGKDTIVWELTKPLPTDGTVDGKYTIKVKAVDKADGVTEESFTFTYDTLVPVITSIVPEDKSTLRTAPTEIMVKVNDGNGSGVDFASSKASMKLKVSGKEIGNILRKDNGIDTITFGLPELEDKGRYTIELTMKDNAGNSYTYQFRFDLIDEATILTPEVVSVSPADRAFKNAVAQVSAVLKDNSGKGLNLKLSTIILEDPKGVTVSGIQTDNDKDTIIWELTSPLPTDGTADGKYTIKVKAVDKSGGVSEKSFSFIYDTLIPVIVSINPEDNSILTKAPEEIVVKVNDRSGSGVDFASSRSSMKLTIGGKEVPNILRKDNGVDTITFVLPVLETKGKYNIDLTMKDNAGNAYTYQFKFDLLEKATDLLPTVTQVDPADRAFKNYLSQVKVVLKDNSGKGLDLDNSTVTLENPRGVRVSGIQTDDDVQTIILELTNPLPADGSADGSYVIKVKAADKAGGKVDYSYSFYYDTVSPVVVSTTPAHNEDFYEGITQVAVILSDTGSGLDLKNTEVKLQGPKALVQSDKKDNGKDTIILTFAKLTDTGSYTIQITPKDKAGNTGYPSQVKFSYVLKPPAVKSVSLTNKAYISKLDKIEAVLDDRSGIGLDLSETGSSITVTGPGGVIQGEQTKEGKDKIIWSPVHPLATDGTDDGTYTVKVTPVDSIGVSGQSRQYTLIYDTQTPEVISASPVDINAEVTYVGQQILTLQAKIKDQGPAGIEIKDQKIYLERKDKTLVSGVQTDNAVDTVVWNLRNPLSKDGTADGSYNLVVIATDQAGNKKEFRYSIIYDTIPPKVTQVTPEDKSMTTKTITSVLAKFSDTGSGIDFQKSGIELRTPSNAKVSGTLSNNGLDTMSLAIAALEESGVYTINVTAIDNAGNGSGNIWKYEFVFRTGLPVVISTDPLTKPPERAYYSSQLLRVTAVLQETDGAGIDLSPTGCEIKLKGPDGKIIVGSQTNDGRNSITYNLGYPLSMDGSDDGVYTILVRTVNSAKRKDDQERAYTFTYDTQKPEVVSITNLNVKSGLSYVTTQITSLEAKLKDNGPAGVDIDRSNMRLLDPNGKQIDAYASNNDVDTLKIEFPSGLSLEGRYSVEINAFDKAGNSWLYRTVFLYSVSLPEVVSTTPVTTPAEKAYVSTQIKEVRAELKETAGSGIDLSSTGSTIKLKGPKGDVLGTQTNDGKRVLIFTLTNPLAANGADDGVYTISVTPVNVAKLKGKELNFTFTYDTVAPKVDKNNINLWYASGAGSSLSEISAVVQDDQPSSGIDWDNVDNSWIKLINSGQKDIPGQIRYDKSKSELRLILDVPLASSGADDGYYTIILSPVDKAGNRTDPVIRYEFMYDTRPPKVNTAEITLNDKPMVLDTSLKEYPTAINTKSGVTITAVMEDESIGVDLTRSSIKIYGPDGKEVPSSQKQNGRDTIWVTTGQLSTEGKYKVEINPVDLDGNGVNKSSETIYTEFLFETTKPTMTKTEPSVATEKSEDKPITIKGTATDPQGGDDKNRIPASGVAKVEIGGIGPGKQRIEWIQAIDESKTDKPAWSNWSLDFLPSVSGTYKIEIRVWDKAGNYEIYDANLELTFTISLSFQKSVYCWPNPVTNGTAHISFEVNAPDGQNVIVRLYVYDISGDLVYEEEHKNIPSKTRMSVDWNCVNMAKEKVATGIYVFRLEAELPDGSIAHKVGKPMVVKN